ncbi:hypothetical protein BX285_2913 [Streptomyces sp. 1114.5]|uniref:hypothetical protein n=1 Tax=Streptomyces sp. 1114.5 TaxID=1938830 RepID=UPI000F2B2B18|nr:hypothetical protein [Streptomyces sp. 1114.5]RKT18490.1 hypothetical protein BX285_2913 [Streptomyces sp. 1114.5]
MATSDGPLRRALRYLESAKNLVGCAGGAVGVGLHYAGLGGNLWPGVVVGLYAVGALLAPGRRPDPSRGPTARPDPGPVAQPTPGALPVPVPAAPPAPEPEPDPEPAPAPAPEPEPDPELEALAAYLGTVPLPPGTGVDDLLTALREAGPGPVAQRIVRERLPVAVAGYLRARTWQPWAGPDAADPAAELGREVGRLAAELA